MVGIVGFGGKVVEEVEIWGKSQPIEVTKVSEVTKVTPLIAADALHEM